MGVVFCKNLRTIPSERVRVNLMILLIFAFHPHKSPSSSIVEECLRLHGWLMRKASGFRRRGNRNDHRMPVVVTAYCKQARLSTPQGVLSAVIAAFPLGSFRWVWRCRPPVLRSESPWRWRIRMASTRLYAPLGRLPRLN